MPAGKTVVQIFTPNCHALISRKLIPKLEGSEKPGGKPRTYPGLLPKLCFLGEAASGETASPVRTSGLFSRKQHTTVESTRSNILWLNANSGDHAGISRRSRMAKTSLPHVLMEIDPSSTPTNLSTVLTLRLWMANQGPDIPPAEWQSQVLWIITR